MAYIAKENLYLDQQGNVVKEGDPNAARLLVAKGGKLDYEQARRFNLIQEDPNHKTARPSPPFIQVPVDNNDNVFFLRCPYPCSNNLAKVEYFPEQNRVHIIFFLHNVKLTEPRNQDGSPMQDRRWYTMLGRCTQGGCGRSHNFGTLDNIVRDFPQDAKVSYFLHEGQQKRKGIDDQRNRTLR